MKKYESAIIGGGFSGLCAAVMLGLSGINSIVVIDANNRIGKKILATGNGQGNISNLDMSVSHYHGDVEFAKYAIGRYGRESLLRFFGRIGLLTAVRDGRIYPANFCASCVCDLLRFALEDRKADVYTDARAESVIKTKNGFVIRTADKREFYADKVIFAFGGSAGDGFSTDGSAYALLRPFGHTVTDLHPSLVQLKTEREKIRGLKGIKQQARVSVISGGKTVRTTEGDVLFTDYGISGNCIFTLSAYLRGLVRPSLEIEFLPDRTPETLDNQLIAKLSYGKTTFERLLVSVLPTRLALAVITAAGLSVKDIANKKTIEKLVGTIKKFSLKIEGTAGFRAAQVTAGGINCKEVCSDSMRSKKCDGVYIIGEALDVDGDCGGYNLQWAFSSAAACAASIAEDAGLRFFLAE